MKAIVHQNPYMPGDELLAIVRSLGRKISGTFHLKDDRFVEVTSVCACVRARAPAVDGLL